MYDMAAVAMVVLASAGVSEDNTRFNTRNVMAVCGKAIYNKMPVPFEVIGHRTLLTEILNESYETVQKHPLDITLTKHDVDMILHEDSADFSDPVQDKLNCIFDQVYKRACVMLATNGRYKEVEWRKANYKHNHDFSCWQDICQVPDRELNKIPPYIANLNLETPFTRADLQSNYNNWKCYLHNRTKSKSN